MPVIQEAFFIPDDIAVGLATGVYRRIGGVVRHAVGPNKGQIVKHLQPVKVKADEATGFAEKALKIAKSNKKLLAIGGTILLVGGGGATIYYYIKNREPEVVSCYRRALRNYVDAIRKGTMTIDIIDELIETIVILKKSNDSTKHFVTISVEDLEVLVQSIKEYTLKLASDNNYEYCDLSSGSIENPIVELEQYLKIQREIFASA